MTIVEPLPDLQWGKGNWQDYISNWRTRDTNWMQERLVLRYQSTALRNAAWPTPSPGHVTYNDETKTLEMWRATAGAWVRSLMFQYLISSQDSAAGTNIFHALSGAKGITIGPTSLLVDTPTSNFLSGTTVIDATGLALKVGTKTAKLSTDATHLISDSPIKATGLDLSGGAGTVLNAAGKVVNVGVLNADSAVIPNITSTGTLTGGIGNFSGVLTGGTVNGAQGTIGGVALSANRATASAGFVSQGAFLRGDANAGYLSHLTGAPMVQVDGSYVRFRSNNGMPWDTNAGAHTGGWVGCVFTYDPGAAAAPNGSIMLL